MRPIRAIIIYNGGSAGDFIKAVCNQQIENRTAHRVTDSGYIDFPNHYFKDTTEAVYRGDEVEMDFRFVQPIENSHYCTDAMKSMADKMYFIDYPDHLHDFIVDRYCQTRLKGNTADLLKIVVQYLPPALLPKINEDNCKSVLKIAYQKNFRLWRQDPDLTAISLRDFVDLPRLILLVKNICQIDDVKSEVLNQSLVNWLAKNPDLIKQLDQEG